MRLLRLRILCLLLAQGLLPLSLLLAGLYWLPAGFLSFVWYGLLAVVVTAVSVGMSGHLARPVRDLAAAFDAMMRSGGEHQPRSRWVPAEFARVQRAFSVLLKDQQRTLSAAESDSIRARQRLSEAERVLQQSFSIVQGVFETSRDGLLVLDRVGSVVASNGELDRILGEPVEAVSGRDGIKLIESIAARLAETGEFKKLVEQATEKVSFAGEIECVTDGEQPLSLMIRTGPLLAETGEVAGRLWLLRDATSERRAAEQLQQAQKMESIGQLAGGIAHDFNNLLTAIRGNLALVEMSGEEQPAAAREKLQGATRATVRAAELVKQLLGYSRKTPPAPRPVDFNQLVTEVENILRHSIDPRIEIVSQPGEDLRMVQADPVQIEQVLLNLCLNARDSLPEHGGRIEISTENHREPPAGDEDGKTAEDEKATPQFVLMRVKDNGCGIPENKRSQIFDPFFSTKAPGKGTGLGLVMAQAIVQEHGGRIEFDTEVGKGTEFRIFLPVATAENVEQSDHSEAEPGAADALGRGKSGNVLIVDDEDSVRSIAVAMLEHMGYQVTQAADGEQALEKIAAAEQPFDAMLLDIYMPKLSGRDTFRRLRADGCRTPVVVCSGFMVDPDEFVALSENGDGPCDIIQKPYSMELLARTVAKAVSRSQPALSA